MENADRVHKHDYVPHAHALFYICWGNLITQADYKLQFFRNVQGIKNRTGLTKYERL